jgi:hypothetical protein
MEQPAATTAIGDAVIFTDSKGRDHQAMCTNYFGPVCINVAYVSDDAARTDSYGRQIERSTSVLHQSGAPAHGNFWRRADEAKKASSEPSAAHAQA